jgi:hypothetical protein
MMTPIGLRVSYKIATGENPIWSNVGKSAVYLLGEKGRFKYEYGLWLEEQLGNIREIRDEYYHYASSWPLHDAPSERPKHQYILWLEDKIINKLNNQL